MFLLSVMRATTRDKSYWEKEWHHGPSAFSPIQDGLLTIGEWSRFDFDDDDASAVLSSTPNLVLEIPEFPEKKNELQVEDNWSSRQKFLPPPTSSALVPSPSSSPPSPPSAVVDKKKYEVRRP